MTVPLMKRSTHTHTCMGTHMHTVDDDSAFDEHVITLTYTHTHTHDCTHAVDDDSAFNEEVNTPTYMAEYLHTSVHTSVYTYSRR